MFMLAIVPLAGLLAFPAAAPVALAARRAADSSAVVTGVVKSEAGAPLEAASVFFQGIGIGSLTKGDGRYRIVVPAARIAHDSMTLAVRLVGYETKDRKVLLAAGRTVTADFTLKSHPIALRQVVVTGAGVATTHEKLGMTVNVAPSSAADAASVTGAVAGRAPAAPMPGELDDKLEQADEVVVVERKAMRADGPSKGNRPGPTVRDAAALPATQGTLRARTPDGEIAGEFPLRHTQVDAEISGYLARTVVTQQYTNPFKDVIEAVYVFPLPSMAAVNDFLMEVGGRRIMGVVRPREEAERIYREARARGQTASLLTQERPNIFTQSVANIEPGGHVDIKITYFERLPYEHGEYEWVFPMVVGPRYIPGNAKGNATFAGDDHRGGTGAGEQGGGWAPNTDVVPDASRITPPVLKPGQRSGHDIALTVTLDAGLPVTKLDIPTHHVEVARPGESRRVIRLAAGDSIPNRDFVLRWSVAGDETQFGVLAHRDGAGDGFLTLQMQPPAQARDEQVTPREITFIMDVSGSMMGLPIDMSRKLVLASLDRLRPDDRFNIVYFASGNAQLWESAQLGTRENVAAAKAFLAHLNAGGGTEMLAGVERALHARHDARYVQMYVFLTDGYVGDETRILSTIKQDRGDARFFGFGIGSAVNRYLIDGIGEVGGGESFVMIPRDSGYVDRGVSRLFDAIDSPVLVDAAVDWNGLPVEDAYPSKLPDLFAGQTIDVIARYTSPARGTIYVTGRVGSRRVRWPVRVELPEREPDHAALA
ncbi:MAG TPA: VIT domain-containing protein, partial [Gemmatimonadaceae bacterium]|nr:VIT domain-containing protein [Gemmatimonadaceae bacterium]